MLDDFGTTTTLSKQRAFKSARCPKPGERLSQIAAIYVVKSGRLQLRFKGDSEFVTVPLIKGDLLPFAIAEVGDGDAEILALSY